MGFVLFAIRGFGLVGLEVRGWLGLWGFLVVKVGMNYGEFSGWMFYMMMNFW